MSRGFFSFMADTEAYRNAEKQWRVNLQRFDKYWYDLVVNPHEAAEYFDSEKLIVNYLKNLKAKVESELEKRFVYFICSRERVRFNTQKKPSYNPLTRTTKLHVLIGKNRTKKSIRCKFFDFQQNEPWRPKIELSEKYITITDARGNLFTSSIHDFLEEAGIALGLDSRVEYVGYTKNPESRPTDGKHAGLSRTLHRLADDSRDSLIYFNLFEVFSHASNDAFMLGFSLANAMTDEVRVELEGNIIEKCFIFYFDATGQDRNRENELAELTNNLRKLSKERKINQIRLHYEFEKPNEYGLFSSSSIKKSMRHVFTVQATEQGVEIMNEEGQVRVFS